MRFQIGLLRPLPLFLPLILFLFACQKPLPDQATWSGTMTLAEGRQLQVRMFLDLQSPLPGGYFLVGEERTPIPELQRNGNELRLIISEYGAEMRGAWDGSQWKGKFIRYRKDTVYLDFSVRPEMEAQERRTERKPSVQLVGTFQVFYEKTGAPDTTTLAKFWIGGDTTYGTFIDPSGDHGLMVGFQEENNVRLHRFTGWQANLIELEWHDGEWRGNYFARQLPPDRFVLKARPSLPPEPIDPRRTRMKNPQAPFVFDGITPDGERIRNADARFRGKVLIVDIMGTWCHNCLDEAPLLQQLYSDFRDDGLEIVGLSFEVSADTTTGKRNLDIYRKRHRLDFPLLFAGSLDAENVNAKLHSQLHDFFAYPTTLFIDRKGRVESIHFGFKGPGTGEEYQREVEYFYAKVRKLLKKN